MTTLREEYYLAVTKYPVEMSLKNTADFFISRMRGMIEELSVCKNCGGVGFIDCEHCEPETHKCLSCGGTGETPIQKTDLLTEIGE